MDTETLGLLAQFDTLIKDADTLANAAQALSNNLASKRAHLAALTGDLEKHAQFAANAQGVIGNMLDYMHGTPSQEAKKQAA